MVSGTCTSNLHGMCESLYRPDLSPDELFEGRWVVIVMILIVVMLVWLFWCLWLYWFGCYYVSRNFILIFTHSLLSVLFLSFSNVRPILDHHYPHLTLPHPNLSHSLIIHSTIQPPLVLSQCLLNAVDRDALSGWGAVVHIITPEGVVTRKLRCRQD